LSRPRRKQAQPAPIDPALEQYIQETVRAEVARLFAPMIELLGLPSSDPNQIRFVLNPEAREILEMTHDTLMLKIKSGDLIAGIHFQGSGKRRSWRPDRLLQYRATEGDEMQRIKDVVRWEKEGFSVDPK
jgi:hypothetical protein